MSETRISAAGPVPYPRTRTPRSCRVLGDPAGTGVVGAVEQQAALGDPVDELLERPEHPFQVAMAFQVVGLDVGHHGDLRPQQQERAITLVGLHQEPLAAAGVPVGPGTGTGTGKVRPDRERGIEAGRQHRGGEQRGGGGLAVGAGHRDAPPAGDHRRQRRCPAQHPQPALPAGHQLGVVRVDGGGVDQRVGAVQVARVLPDRDLGTQLAQPGDGRRLPALTPGHRHPAGQQDPGQRAHPGPGDAHHVHPAELGSRRHHLGGGAGHQGRAGCRPADRPGLPGSRRADPEPGWRLSGAGHGPPPGCCGPAPHPRRARRPAGPPRPSPPAAAGR